MKKLVFFVFISIVTAFAAAAHFPGNESSSPSYDTEISRHCMSCDIEGMMFNNVIVTVKSNNPLNNLNGDSMVKITIKDVNEKTVYKKKVKAYLYIFSSGQIEVGQPKFTQVLITKNGDCLIRLKEGIF